MRFIVLGIWIGLLVGIRARPAWAGSFEDLGIPVSKALLMGVAVGPDAGGKKELLYFNFAPTGATLFIVVVDPETGAVHEISLGLHSDGLLYGLAGNAVFSVDPSAFEMKKLGEYSGKISRGFALTGDAIYFGSGPRLARFKL